MPKTQMVFGDVLLDLDEFPGNREYMGTIRTSAGCEYKVYMPIVYDYASIDMSKSVGSYELGAKSIGISYLEFQTWSFPDAQLVMGKLSDAVNTLYHGGKK